MKTIRGDLSKVLKWHLIFLSFVFLLVMFTQSSLQAQSITVNVIDDSGNPITNGFRWLLEEDNTFYVTPGVSTPSPGKPESHTLGVNIHRSHSPVVCSGDTASSSVTLSNGVNGCVISSSKRYMVSVLPWHSSPPGTPATLQKGWTMSARNVNLAGGQTSVTVVVHPFPVPTAQITILAFHDNQPINFAYDQPAESGLAGFTVLLTDPIGQVMQDAWGNPIGTTYQLDPVTKQPFLGADGFPIVDYMGNGSIKTCPTGDVLYDAANCVNPDGTPMGAGEAVIRFLPGNKYTIEIVPPDNDPD